MRFTYYMFSVLTIIIIIYLIRNNILKNNKIITHEMLVISSLRTNSRFFVAIFFIGIYLIFMRFFLPSFFKAYTILIPNYLNKWYELFWLDNIIKYIHYFYINEMIFEAIDLVLYYRILIFFVLSFPCLFISLYFGYLGLQRIVICKNGVYVAGKLIEWDNFKCFQCNGPIKKKNQEYYYLFFYKKDDKRHSSDTDLFNTIKVLITLEEKNKIQNLIEEII